jgi:urease accessory protein
MDTLSFLNGLRFVDSFFPSGGYAFSTGLEAAVQERAVRDVEELRRYVEDVFRSGLARCEAVAVGESHRALTADDLGRLLSVDAELDAMKLARESRLAGRQMGCQVIRLAAEQIGDHGMLRAFLKEIESGRTPGHAATGLGMTFGACGWPRELAVAAYLYQTAVGLVSAAMKLLPIGQREGQRLLAEWAPLIVQWAMESGRASWMSSWTPVQDIYAMRHARLRSRLFRS